MPDFAFDDFLGRRESKSGHANSTVLISVVIAFLSRQNGFHTANTLEHSLGTIYSKEYELKS